MTRDPVCGMDVDVSRAATASFQETTFSFCSATCKAAFEEAPGEYEALWRRVPPALPRLLELARNLWWTWHPEARALFETLAGRGPEQGDGDPVELLLATPVERLVARAGDPRVLALYREVLAAFDRDMAAPPARALLDARGTPATIAYFSAEFGVHHSLPVYSGGLGVLAGDTAKEASDLAIPLIGVGFMYPEGYFRQRVSADGWQEERYERLDRPRAPAEPACTEAGQRCVITLALPGRSIEASVWVVRVGRVRLYLMDTDLGSNPPGDRELSVRLYGGDQDLRIRQEILLGVGGVRLLRAFGITPALWHANEGHAAFMMLERARELVEAGQPFDQAVDAVRASTVFTTHTPVAAGHDVFPAGLVDRYLGGYWPGLGLDRERFLALGKPDGASEGTFNMTALALRLSRHRNAVSRRHGEVSRRMWRGLWPDRPEDRVPIASVTNGVHVPSWVAPELDALYRASLGPDWRDRHDDVALWGEGVGRIPDQALWETHQALKRRLLRFLQARARQRWRQDRSTPVHAVVGGVLLDPAALTLGFARRFATYKRASLLLHDVRRLRAILTDGRRPVQIIFAGKAHPADEPAKLMLQEVYRAAMTRTHEGRIALVEDYDMQAARYLVQGVDVWLNTPRSPLEASGTSGMKAALNGIPNLSVPDGWWAEGHDGTNGWVIGSIDADTQVSRGDAADADALYRLLETEVVPLFYERDEADVPVRWVHLMRRAIQTVAPRFSARRMLKEYVERLYRPALRGTVVAEEERHP